MDDSTVYLIMIITILAVTFIAIFADYRCRREPLLGDYYDFDEDV